MKIRLLVVLAGAFVGVAILAGCGGGGNNNSSIPNCGPNSTWNGSQCVYGYGANGNNYQYQQCLAQYPNNPQICAQYSGNGLCGNGQYNPYNPYLNNGINGGINGANCGGGQWPYQPTGVNPYNPYYPYPVPYTYYPGGGNTLFWNFSYYH